MQSIVTSAHIAFNVCFANPKPAIMVRAAQIDVSRQGACCSPYLGLLFLLGHLESGQSKRPPTHPPFLSYHHLSVLPNAMAFPKPITSLGRLSFVIGILLSLQLTPFQLGGLDIVSFPFPVFFSILEGLPIMPRFVTIQ